MVIIHDDDDHDDDDDDDDDHEEEEEEEGKDRVDHGADDDGESKHTHEIWIDMTNYDQVASLTNDPKGSEWADTMCSQDDSYVMISRWSMKMAKIHTWRAFYHFKQQLHLSWVLLTCTCPMPMKCYVGYTLCVSFIFDHIPTCLHMSISQTSLWIYHIPDRAEAFWWVGAGEVTSLEWWKLEEMEILFLVILI